MTKKLLVPALVLFLSVIGAFILVATAPSVENVVPERALTAVRIRNAEPQSVRLRVRTQGTVAPRTESAVVPEVSGRVVWVSPALVSGGFFEAAEPLLRIETRSHRSEDRLTRLVQSPAGRDQVEDTLESAECRLHGPLRRHVAAQAE